MIPPGGPAVVDGEVGSVITLEAHDGLVTSLFFVRNPEKPTRLDDAVLLSR